MFNNSNFNDMKDTMKTPETKKVYNLIIVDESGSMSIIREQALAGLNETIETCQKMQELHPELEQRITLISFDSNHFKIHLDNEPAGKARKLTTEDYRPNAATPLYDAIGKGIAKLNAQTGTGDNVLVTIITDGEENCSQEYNLKLVKNLIEKQKQQGWTFTLIGTDNLDVEGMAGSLSIDNHLAFTEDASSTEKMFAKERKARARYYASVACGRVMEEGSYFSES
jgi:Mg-chelatase subunit ChlD